MNYDVRQVFKINHIRKSKRKAIYAKGAFKKIQYLFLSYFLLNKIEKNVASFKLKGKTLN